MKTTRTHENAADTSLLEQGRRDRDAGETLTALRRFTEATSASPDDPEGYVETAITLRDLRLTAQARAKLEPALTRWPNRWDVLMEMGRLASAQGDATTALRSYERIIQLTPTTAWAEPYIGAAMQHCALDRLEDAETIINQGLAVCDSEIHQRTYLLEAKAPLLTSAGRLSEAVATLTASVSESGRFARIWEATLPLTHRGDFTAALRLLDDLQPVVRRYCSDSWSYDKYIEAVHRASRLASAVDHRSRYDSRARSLHLTPHTWTAEHGLDSLRDRAGRSHQDPTRHYVFVDNSHPSLATDGRGSLDPLLTDDEELFSYPLRRRQWAHYTYVLPNAHVFDNLGTDARSIVIFHDHAFVSDLLAYHYPAALCRLALRDSRRAASDALQMAFMLPSGGGWLNYYHSIVDIFSSLTIYRMLDLSCPIITPGPMNRFHWDLFQHSGIPEDTPLLSAEQIRDRPITTIICPEGASGHLIRDWSAATVASVDAQPDLEAPRILYVSRRHAPGREMANEAELESALERYFGVPSITMEQLAFDTQVLIARGAKVMIGPHGAGLTNICFAEAGAWLVELVPDRHPVPIFRDLAAVVGARYVPIAGEVADIDSLTWRVDVKRVLDVLTAIFDHEA